MCKFDLKLKCIIIFLISIFIFSCNKAKETNELIISVGPEPQTIDPTMNSAIDASIYTMHVFENLTAKDETTVAKPAAAESFTVGDDNMSYTFKIRSNAVWSDGKPLTANDFVYAWRRIVNPKTGSSYATFLDVVKNANAISQGKMPVESLGVKALDDKTLYVELESPVTYFDELVSHPAYTPLREDIVSTNEESWTLDYKTYIGNGPFKLVSWEHNSKIVMEKNTNYWNASDIVPEKIEFALIDDANTAMAGILNGNLYFYRDTPPSDREKLIAEGYAKVIPDIALYFYEVNHNIKPFNDERVRKALMLAIDRDYIVNAIMKGGEVPAAAIVPFNIMDDGKEYRSVKKEYFSTKKEDYENNVKEAKRLLAEAGYSNGQGFPVIEFITNPGFHTTVAESIQSMLKEALNINMTISTQEWAVLIQTRRDGNFEMARQGWVGGYNHPMAFLSLVKTGYVLNEGRYSNPEYDKQIDLALKSKDAKDRSAALHKAEDIAMNDTAVIPIFYYTTTVMQRPELTNVMYDIFGMHSFKKASIVK